MEVSHSAVQTNLKAGMCPHGMPPSSCPICSGGGFAARSKPQQWSYAKCYAVGMQLKAAAKRHEAARNFLEKQFNTALTARNNMQNFYAKIEQFIQNIKYPMLQAPIRFAAANIIKPVFNIFENIRSKTFNMLFQAGEKLSGILGEIKNFIQKTISENLKKHAKKFLLFCFSGIEDENYKNDDILAVFKSREMKKYSMKILRKTKNKNEHGTDKK